MLSELEDQYFGEFALKRIKKFESDKTGKISHQELLKRLGVI